MKKLLCSIFAIMLSLSVLTGCSKSPTEPAPEPTATAIPTATPNRNVTPPPNATATVIATAVVTATPGTTPGTTPEPTPTPGGGLITYSVKYQITAAPIAAGSYWNVADIITYTEGAGAGYPMNVNLPWEVTTSMTTGQVAHLTFAVNGLTYVYHPDEINNTRYTLRIFKNGAVVQSVDFIPTTTNPTTFIESQM